MKLEHAHMHLVELNKQVREFRRSSPYEFDPQIRHPHPTCDDVYFQIVVRSAPELPDSWPLIVGDILTNLRAALDHSVYEHIRSKKPDLKVNEIQFPIVDKPGGMTNKKGWFDRAVYRAINDAQPYHSDEPHWHSLAILRDLVNADKHRALLVTNYASLQFKIDTEPELTVASAKAHIGAEMEAGAVVASGQFKIPEVVTDPTVVKVHTEIGYSEVIEIPKSGGQVRNLTDTLCDLHDATAAVLDDLKSSGVT
ncbi:hypothetical protein C5E51_35425 [Nocardia nova]|uniref:hypothetical protein n=1 Tax=Nocardia nova TaxID=37330 RepID=UPI000CEA00A2|nr:hypothetical protein [Nocardia nova]PPJ00189.1 hypothetical protein C5E51_35425 [Nocardia nova]